MDCLTCRERFTELLEAPAHAPLAAAHLSECEACTTAFAAFRDTVRRLRNLPVVAPPPELLHSISAALDAEPTQRRSGVAFWQPLTAGLSMAACVCLLLWSVVLHPVTSTTNWSGPQVAYQAPSAPMASAPPVGAAPAMAPTAAPGPRAGAPAPRPMRRLEGRFQRASLPPARPGMSRPAQPPLFGAWGERLAKLSPISGTGQPAQTFAAGDPTTPTAPLQRRAGPVELAFAPPVERIVGEPVVGELTVTGQAEAMVKVRVTAETGLQVTNARDGVAYAGPLRQGEALKVPLRLMAWRPGAQRLRVQLESDVPGVAGDLAIRIDGFVGELGKNGEAMVSLRFHETPSHRAIRRLAAAAGARVVIHEDVETKSVTLDFSAGVPFAAALRILCDDCGTRIEERNGVYHILP